MSEFAQRAERLDALLAEHELDLLLSYAHRQGVTPLAHARSRGYAAMVEILERAGAR